MSQYFQGQFGPLVLTFCGPSPNFEDNWPEGLPYFDPFPGISYRENVNFYSKLFFHKSLNSYIFCGLIQRAFPKLESVKPCGGQEVNLL